MAGANAQEEERELQRQLHIEYLNSSIAGNLCNFDIDDTISQNTVKVVPSRTDNFDSDLETWKARAAKLPTEVTRDQKGAFITHGLAKAARGGKTVTKLERVEDRSEDLTVSHFRETMLINSGISIVEILGTTFATFPFVSELQRAEMKFQLLDFAYKQATRYTVPPPNPEAGRSQELYDSEVAAKNNREEMILQELGDLNLAQLRKDNESRILEQGRAENLRSNTIAESMQGKLVTVPLTGNTSVLSSHDLKTMYQHVNNTSYGSGKEIHDLQTYLEIVKSQCENEYTEKGIYTALMYVLCGRPKDLVKTHYEDNSPLSAAWMDLQISFSDKPTETNCSLRISEIIKTRPVRLLEEMTEIARLTRLKNDNLDHTEKKHVVNSEVKTYLMGYLRNWYPYHISNITQRFEVLKQQGKLRKVQPTNDTILKVIARDMLKNVVPIYRGGSIQQKRKAHVNSMEAGEKRTEEDLVFLSLENPDDIEICVMGEYSSNAATHGSEGRRSTLKMFIPPEFKNRCLKCGNANHFGRDCDKYKGKITTTSCKYCNCFHAEECLNMPKARINEMETSPNKETSKSKPKQ